MQYYPVTDVILLSNHRSGTEGNRNASSHTDHINHSNNKSSDTHQQHHHRRVSGKYSEVINDILKNIDKGFNACLLTMGMSNSGKTYNLFGDLGCYDCIQSINVDHDDYLWLLRTTVPQLSPCTRSSHSYVIIIIIIYYYFIILCNHHCNLMLVYSKRQDERSTHTCYQQVIFSCPPSTRLH